jgi:hypothetical protein
VKKTSKRTGASRKRSSGPGTRAAARPPYEGALLAFAALATRLRIRWYVFGAQAVNLHGFPRATADLDLTVDLGDRSVATFVAALSTAGFTARFRDTAFITSTRVIPVVHDASGMPIDLVLAGPGLEQLFLDEAETRRIGRRSIRVLSLENLIVTKLLAGRPKDLEDVRELVARQPGLDRARIDALLQQLEEALDQSDLRVLWSRIK